MPLANDFNEGTLRDTSHDQSDILHGGKRIPQNTASFKKSLCLNDDLFEL